MFSEIKAIRRNDPSARFFERFIYPTLYAVVVHRWISHPLYRIHLYFFARLISFIMRFLTGVEIHPGARIGKGLFIDHGMGTVIGETAVIGQWCVLYHGVTLGGTGKVRGKRHPSLGNNVLVGAHSTLLGAITVGDNVHIGAETVVICRNIPSDCTVVGAPGRIVRLGGEKVNLPLTEFCADRERTV